MKPSKTTEINHKITGKNYISQYLGIDKVIDLGVVRIEGIEYYRDAIYSKGKEFFIDTIKSKCDIADDPALERLENLKKEIENHV